MALLSVSESVHYFILNIRSNIYLPLGVLTILLLLSYWYLTIPRGIPPGPLGLPLVGYLPFIGQTPQKTFINLSKKYGPMFSMYLGSNLAIILNDYESIKEAFLKQADIFSGRPKNLILTALPHETYSIVFSDGPIWKEHRRFALNVLRDCGFGKLSIEPGIMEEIHHFISEIKKFNGKPKDFYELLSLSISNNICILSFGKTFNYDDPWLITAKRVTDELVRQTSAVTIFQVFPWINYIPGIAKLAKQGKLINSMNNLDETIQIIIEGIKKSHVDGQRDSYMSAYVDEQKKRKEKQMETETFLDTGLQQNIRLLLAAGTETTSSTVRWIIKYLMNYPEVQEKVQKEIDDVIGSDRTPSWNDRQRTPYTEATIYEVQRIATLFPINVPHRNFTDCKVGGYDIPKDSYILANLWAIHHDAKLWKDPDVFRPERFLSENGAILKPEYFMPFSIGKRQCLGESLARMEIYLYTTALLQKFTFKEAEGTNTSLEGRPGFTYVPKDFCPRAILRVREGHEPSG